METQERHANRIDPLLGTLDTLILRIVQLGPQQVGMGSLHPALHWRAKRGWLSPKWALSPNNHREKVYNRTATNTRHLTGQRSECAAQVRAIGCAMKAMGAA